MGYIFEAFGHRNILATHKTTLEFTKDCDLSRNGDCIIGVRSNFELGKLKAFLKTKAPDYRLNMQIMVNGQKFILNAGINPDFSDGHEIVIRKSGFASSRTLAVHSDAGAIDIPRDIVRLLQNPNTKVQISFL